MYQPPLIHPMYQMYQNTMYTNGAT